MTDTQIFEPDGRAIPFVVEGEGPVSLVLIPEPGQDRDVLGVISHYLVEEAGFHVVRIGIRPDAGSLDESVADAVAVIDHLGLEHTWIGGHGAGGTVARAFSAVHHDRVNGLLLLGVEDQDIPLAPVIPVLIIQGSTDDVTPPVHGEQLQATAPERASLKVIAGAGHLFPATNPIDTAFIIEEYLDWD
ncbi:alpha/beta hydrolase [Microbacterium sp. 2FI]|uniref:alpha/beta fold hydrolase n=1 Tax=Microbacterium sp. 2FI TaxID=2502193 RepID=UPI0010F6CF37|nr:alpha/beta hydrolase [Microbacterium sp. 2FI]